MRFQNVTDDLLTKASQFIAASQFFLAQASQSVGDRSSLVADSRLLFSSDETLRSDADVQIIDRRHHVSMG